MHGPRLNCNSLFHEGLVVMVRYTLLFCSVCSLMRRLIHHHRGDKMHTTQKSLPGELWRGLPLQWNRQACCCFASFPDAWLLLFNIRAVTHLAHVFPCANKCTVGCNLDCIRWTPPVSVLIKFKWTVCSPFPSCSACVLLKGRAASWGQVHSVLQGF